LEVLFSEDEILKLKEPPSEPQRLQRFKSQSTDELHKLPGAGIDKISITERLRNKLFQRGQKINVRDRKDSGGKKPKESFKRLNTNSVFIEEDFSIQTKPKCPIFGVEIDEVAKKSNS